MDASWYIKDIQAHKKEGYLTSHIHRQIDRGIQRQRERETCRERSLLTSTK